jgi:hypothetical protein
MADQGEAGAQKGAPEESRSDLRDERDGAADPVNAPTGESQPAGLRRERKGPLSPRLGRRPER